MLKKPEWRRNSFIDRSMLSGLKICKSTTNMADKGERNNVVILIHWKGIKKSVKLLTKIASRKSEFQEQLIKISKNNTIEIRKELIFFVQVVSCCRMGVDKEK